MLVSMLRICPRWLGVVGLVAFAVLSASCFSGDDSEATPDPTPVPFPELTPFAADVAARLHAIRDGASEVRELPLFVESSDGTVSREALQAYIDAFYENLTDEERREAAAANVVLRMLGLIDQDDDVVDLFRQSLGEGIAGLYFDDEDKLVLIGDGRNLFPGHETTLAHEYIHSLQDGFFDFGRFDRLLETENEDPETTTEYDVTLDCVREGDATFGSFLWARQEFGEEWADVVFPDEGEAPPQENDYPEALSRYGAFNYNECVSFAAALYGEGGWDAVNEAYFRPPTSTEQVLHAGKYLAGERATRLPAPDDVSRTLGDGWERLDLDVFGEFDVFNYVATLLDDEDAGTEVAAGWGAGWIAVYRHRADDDEATPSPEVAAGEDVLLHITLEWDSQADYTEFDEAFRRIASAMSGGTARGDDVRVLCWSTETEHAFYLGEPNGGHNHLIITTNRAARDAALTQRIEGRLFGCPA